ncbi:restriction endonuclease subunit S [Corynebacterium sp. ZY180755]
MAAFPMVPLKHAIETRFTGVWGSDEGADEVDVPCVRIADFNRETKTAGEAIPTVRSLPEKVLSDKCLRTFDILLEKSGGGEKTPVGDAMLYIGAGDVVCANFIEVIRPKSDSDSRYLVYSLGSNYSSGSTRPFVRQTIGIQNLDLQRYFDQAIPLPDLDTQRRIADYLDSETAQIDTLTAELDGYVELLKKRKDQLVEAKLTEIQAPLCAVGFVGDVLLGKMVNSSPSTDADELRPYLRAAHVQPHGVMDFSVPEKLMWFTPFEVERLDLKAGDVVVVEGGAGYGRSSCLTEEMDGWGFQNSINRIRPLPERARGEYLSLMINRALARGEIGIASNVATIPHFTAEKLARFRIPVPSVEVQDEFLDVVLAELTQTDTIITQCRELKELLLKRRQVLITDVVTGKVEV